MKDVLIIGTGPAGLTAGIYSRRFNLETLIIGTQIGGLAAEAHRVGNFPSEKEIAGTDLIQKMEEHATHLGAEVKSETVTSLSKEDSMFKCTVSGGAEFRGRTLLLASGTKRRKLNLPNEEKFLGRGVSYCAVCDGAFFRDKTVGVVGGSNAAVTAALYLSEIAKKVFLIYRKGKLRAEPLWIKQLEKRDNVVAVFNTNVVGLLGKENLEKVKLDNPYQNDEYLNIEGLFVEIGSVPDKTLSDQLGVSVDERGFIKIDPAGKTSVEGVWAAGDITTGSNNFRQIITACAEGAVAAQSIYEQSL
jgi:thioredoxin reductase (NADPH)